MTERIGLETGDLTSTVRAGWEEVLEHEDFGPDTDFFAAGGNSFLVAKVMAGLSKQLGLRLPLRLFFTDPTVRGLSRNIAEHQEAR
jgi:acyl carrier protein